MRDTRLLAASVLVLCAACAHGPRDRRAHALLDEAIAAAGGADALGAARVLAWTGDATVTAGGRTIAIKVDTEVEPFVRARSRSWPSASGASAARLMEIDATGGWLTRDGTRTALPSALVEHERQQYAVYGWMRLLPLRDPALRLARDDDRARGLRCLHVDAPTLRDARFCFDGAARLASIDNRVDAADGAGPIAQRFEFEGTLESNGVRWPQRMRITQAGAPYFDLRLRSFATRPR